MPRNLGEGHAVGSKSKTWSSASVVMVRATQVLSWSMATCCAASYTALNESVKGAHLCSGHVLPPLCSGASGPSEAGSRPGAAGRHMSPRGDLLILYPTSVDYTGDTLNVTPSPASVLSHGNVPRLSGARHTGQRILRPDSQGRRQCEGAAGLDLHRQPRLGRRGHEPGLLPGPRRLSPGKRCLSGLPGEHLSQQPAGAGQEAASLFCL